MNYREQIERNAKRKSASSSFDLLTECLADEVAPLVVDGKLTAEQGAFFMQLALKAIKIWGDRLSEAKP